VLAVAELVARHHLLLAIAPEVVGADLDARVADADGPAVGEQRPRRAVVAGPRVAVVAGHAAVAGDAVAVVVGVGAVALLGLRVLLARARAPLAGHAGLGAHVADAHPGRS